MTASPVTYTCFAWAFVGSTESSLVANCYLAYATVITVVSHAEKGYLCKYIDCVLIA